MSGTHVHGMNDGRKMWSKFAIRRSFMWGTMVRCDVTYDTVQCDVGHCGAVRCNSSGRNESMHKVKLFSTS